jgi:hypothetical protein
MKIDHGVIGFGAAERRAAAAGRGRGVRAFGSAMVGAVQIDNPMPLHGPEAA